MPVGQLALPPRVTTGPHPPPSLIQLMYSEFLNLVRTGNVRACRFEESSSRITFDLHPHSSAAAAVSPRMSRVAVQPADAGAADATTATVTVHGVGPQPRQFYTKRLAADTALIPTLMAAGVEFGLLKQSFTATILRWVRWYWCVAVPGPWACMGASTDQQGMLASGQSAQSWPFLRGQSLSNACCSVGSKQSRLWRLRCQPRMWQCAAFFVCHSSPAPLFANSYPSVFAGLVMVACAGC